MGRGERSSQRVSIADALRRGGRHYRAQLTVGLAHALPRPLSLSLLGAGVETGGARGTGVAFLSLGRRGEKGAGFVGASANMANTHCAPHCERTIGYVCLLCVCFCFGIFLVWWGLISNRHPRPYLDPALCRRGSHPVCVRKRCGLLPRVDSTINRARATSTESTWAESAVIN
jgi:hypothetical protein